MTALLAAAGDACSSDTATPQDVLREASRILMRDGWTQNALGVPGGPRCQLGARISASIRLHAPVRVRAAADEIFEDWLRANYDTSAGVHWNDAPERTAEDVILALKRAAEES